MRKSFMLIGLSAGMLALSGCALGSSTAPGGAAGAPVDGPLSGTTVTVASKEFTEQLVLCEISAQRLESQGATVRRICGMSGSATVRAAEESGDVDMYWEYTGTGWISFLGQTEAITDGSKQYELVRDMDLEQNQIVWLPPAQANNTYAIAVKAATAEKLGVKTISDYAALSQSDPSVAGFCGASEFFGRDDGWPGLAEAYGISVPADQLATLAAGPIYDAIDKGAPCNFGEVFATDGRIAALGLTVLEDDKNFFPFYNLSLTMRADFHDANPQVVDLMEPVSKLLTTEVLQQLNASVDVDGQTPEAVSADWLSTNNLN